MECYCIQTVLKRSLDMMVRLRHGKNQYEVIIVLVFLVCLELVLNGLIFFFFFQAEDGIRDGRVTGVQTCALPIYANASSASTPPRPCPIRRRRKRTPLPNFRRRVSRRNNLRSQRPPARNGNESAKIGRASCRERV